MTRALLLLAIAATTARAHPVDDEIEMPFEPSGKPYRPFVCPANKSWTKLQHCLATRDKVIVLRDLPNAKLVRMQGQNTATLTLALFMRVQDQWIRTGFYGDLGNGSNGEMLLFDATKDGSIRIDMGYAYVTGVSLDEITSTPALLRRAIAWVCKHDGQCQSVITTCELSMRGKVYWWFRGTPAWVGNVLRVKGNPANAGQTCAMPQALLEGPSP